MGQTECIPRTPTYIESRPALKLAPRLISAPDTEAGTHLKIQDGSRILNT